jgi:diguanylate cyclase (GGDEF)-like protein
MFTIYLARKNSLVNPVKTKYYLKSAIIVCVILVCEILDVILDNTGSSFRVQRILVNTIAFFISPIVPLSITYLHNEKFLQYKKYLIIPFAVMGVLALTSWMTGWIFLINENNEYYRGPFFVIYPMIMFFYFIILIYSDYENYKRYEKDEIIFLYSLYIIITIGTAIQLMHPKWLLIWTSISMSLMLYYIFLRELQFKLDPMTQIFNRSVFQKDMLRIGKLTNVGIVVIDINNLKEANDRYGHAIGDDIIIKAAQTIKGCFDLSGKAFRIGGDEFCIICENTSDEKMHSLLTKLDTMSASMNKNLDVAIALARGFCIYNPDTMRDVYEAFSIADQRMYYNKELIKMCKFNNDEEMIVN